jgi:hypothetical protein
MNQFQISMFKSSFDESSTKRIIKIAKQNNVESYKETQTSLHFYFNSPWGLKKFENDLSVYFENKRNGLII